MILENLKFFEGGSVRDVRAVFTSAEGGALFGFSYAPLASIRSLLTIYLYMHVPILGMPRSTTMLLSDRIWLHVAGIEPDQWVMPYPQCMKLRVLACKATPMLGHTAASLILRSLWEQVGAGQSSAASSPAA
jgi:hypothetical protein